MRYKIDDYYDIVKKPMDFGTVKVMGGKSMVYERKRRRNG